MFAWGSESSRQQRQRGNDFLESERKHVHLNRLWRSADFVNSLPRFTAGRECVGVGNELAGSLGFSFWESGWGCDWI